MHPSPPLALLTEFYTTNLSVAAFPFEPPPSSQRFAAQRTHGPTAEEEEERKEGEGNGARASVGRFGGGLSPHLLAHPYAAPAQRENGGWNLEKLPKLCSLYASRS